MCYLKVFLVVFVLQWLYYSGCIIAVVVVSSTKDLGLDSTGQVKPKTIKKSLKIPNE
jgi:hypothetical protein